VLVVFTIALIEIAPAEQRNPHRPQIARAHDHVIGVIRFRLAELSLDIEMAIGMKPRNG
jgi:hypothetical protein